MIYTLVFEDGFDVDLKHLDPVIAHRIFRIILKKIKVNPLGSGLFLYGELHPHRKLKVGACHIVYRVYEEEHKVSIIAVGKRANDDVYVKALKRIEND